MKENTMNDGSKNVISLHQKYWHYRSNANWATHRYIDKILYDKFKNVYPVVYLIKTDLLLEHPDHNSAYITQHNLENMIIDDIIFDNDIKGKKFSKPDDELESSIYIEGTNDYIYVVERQHVVSYGDMKKTEIFKILRYRVDATRCSELSGVNTLYEFMETLTGSNGLALSCELNPISIKESLDTSIEAYDELVKEMYRSSNIRDVFTTNSLKLDNDNNRFCVVKKTNLHQLILAADNNYLTLDICELNKIDFNFTDHHVYEFLSQFIDIILTKDEYNKDNIGNYYICSYNESDEGGNPFTFYHIETLTKSARVMYKYDTYSEFISFIKIFYKQNIIDEPKFDQI